MRIPAHYILTPKISHSLASLEASREVIDSYPLAQEIEVNMRRESILKSSLFSARIEGNPLTLDEVTAHPSGDQKKREVYNILKGRGFVHSRGFRDLSIKAILELHTKIMEGLAENPGRFRTEQSAIFNPAGIAIYLSPPSRHVSALIERLLKFANSAKEPFVPLRAVLTHYSFEKIHPFLDGNGRVGRLIIQAVLEKGSYGMKGLLTFEEYLDNHRAEYYRSLEETERDVTGYCEFMLHALSESAKEAKEMVLTKQKAEVTDYLLPRRAEIFNIIKDHRIVNFDQIRRRFIAVNERTLRYDLKRLQDGGFIRKRGTTKGVYYEISHN